MPSFKDKVNALRVLVDKIGELGLTFSAAPIVGTTLSVRKNRASLYVRDGQEVRYAIDCWSQRGGVRVWADGMSIVPKGATDPRYEIFVLSSMLKSLFEAECARLFVNDKNKNGWNSSAKGSLLKAVEHLLRTDGCKVPMVRALAEELSRQVGKLMTPLDLWINDARAHIMIALSKGATRDQLVDVIDELVVKNVMET